MCHRIPFGTRSALFWRVINSRLCSFGCGEFRSICFFEWVKGQVRYTQYLSLTKWEKQRHCRNIALAFPPRAERVGCSVGQLGNISSLAAGKSTCSLLVNIFIWVCSSDHSRKSSIHACAFQLMHASNWPWAIGQGSGIMFCGRSQEKEGKEAGGQKLKWRMHHYVWVFFIPA